MASYLPEEWSNDNRMKVMMDVLPSDIHSPAYQSKYNFWSSALHCWAKEQKLLSFSLNDAKKAFQRNYLTPAALKDVLEIMIKKKEIIIENEFFKNYEQTWIQWTGSAFISPYKYIFSQVKKSLGYNVEDSLVYINNVLLMEISDKLLNDIWSQGKTEVFSISSLHQFLIPYSSKLDDHEIILHYLKRKNTAAIAIIDDELLVKINPPGNIEPVTITEAELAEYKILNTKDILSKKIDHLKGEIRKYQIEAKNQLKNGTRKEALRFLKKKKQTNVILEKLTSTYDNISLCLEQLKETQINQDVMVSFKIGLDALRCSVAEGNSCDEVEDTLDELEDILLECKDISEAMSTDLTPYNDKIDDDEFEKELSELMSNADIADDEVCPLPDTPMHDPLSEVSKSFIEVENS